MKQIIRSIFFLILLGLPLTCWSNESSPVKLESEQKSIIKPQKKPVLIEADRITGYYKQEIEAVGDAVLHHGDNVLTADRMKYYQQTEDAEVEGSVRLERPNDVLQGQRLEINLKTEVGQLTEPRYSMKEGKGRGAGDILLFEGKDNYRIKDTNYTACPEGNHDWYLRAKELEIDNKKEVGTARHVSVVFKDVPLLYSPWLDFSYSGKRKSGLLTPVAGYNVRTGFDVGLPVYLNIAPNIDATITPRIMTERGFLLSNEFRYIGNNNMNGHLQLDILPHDIVRNQTRWGILFTHTQNLGKGWQGFMNYNQVSDDRYFRELTPNLAQTSLVNLSQQGGVNYNGRLGTDGVLNFTGFAQRFQTIQDPFALIVSPYERLPHFAVNAAKYNVGGKLDFELQSSWTNFYHPTLVDGNRTIFYPSVSAPLRNEYGYITPKFGLHYTHYNLATPVDTKGENVDRTVPIVSLDSGIAFDRQLNLGDRNIIQTLEPRLFYVYAPYRNQDYLPNFDSAVNDFSFAQMLTENKFSGGDRINDANRAVAALTSRFVDKDTGVEFLRLAVGQMVNFTDPRIQLPLPQVTSGRSDFIAAISGRLTQDISTDSNVQIDQSKGVIEKIRSGISYQPEPGKVLNFGYRFTRDVREQVDTSIEQVDTSMQWPIYGNLRGVTRVNYSLNDDKILAGLAGLEYNSCCWALRVVLQRLTTATQTTTTAFFLQLELKGLMGLGNNPLQVLQQTIPGYTSVH
ncbi:LPS-assembly protein LptD [Nitrosomonas ureae]|uniref:LPS-assembly protein LptD n=1 Tax=Nitrosomonas ureae TaxID=44577 RepID=A0A2T5IML0_9PROT|nr:LPS-assembly protein LptD [Nitrosomonas ureae]PTQ85072.1 LPS-assembly protein [Nitrosomonas ureae]